MNQESFNNNQEKHCVSVYLLHYRNNFETRCVQALGRVRIYSRSFTKK